jgi:hypothetical protein
VHIEDGEVCIVAGQMQKKRLYRMGKGMGKGRYQTT